MEQRGESKSRPCIPALMEIELLSCVPGGESCDEKLPWLAMLHRMKFSHHQKTSLSTQAPDYNSARCLFAAVAQPPVQTGVDLVIVVVSIAPIMSLEDSAEAKDIFLVQVVEVFNNRSGLRRKFSVYSLTVLESELSINNR